MSDQQKSIFDVVVIGGGPGGYVAAIKASSYGLKVALVERASHLGGTCLNVGCVPTKALLESAKTWHKLQHLAGQGFHLGAELSYDWKQILQRKDSIVAQQRKGLRYLMKRHNITVFAGHGSLESQQQGGEHLAQVQKIKVQKIESGGGGTQQEEAELLSSSYVILATGSQVRRFAPLPQEHPRFYNSSSILDVSEVPRRLAIVGGGVIGMEFASLFAMLGTEVTVVEAAERILAGFDADLVAEYMKYCRSLPLKVHTSASVVGWREMKGAVELSVEGIEGSGAVLADGVLVCVGREPSTQNLGLQQQGVSCDEQGYVVVDEHYRTSVAGVYAIGDVICTPALAHSASAEGLHVAQLLGAAHQPSSLPPPPLLPSHHHPLAVYTYPELASIGWNERQLEERGVEYSSTRFPFAVMAKAKIAGEDMGFIKVLSEASSGEVLGLHIVGARATEMISEGGLAMVLEATLDELTAVIRPHPTLSETLSEALHSALGHPLHL